MDSADLQALQAVVEQAKGVLIFRYSIDAAAAGELLGRWAGLAGVDERAVAQVVVHDICQGCCVGDREPWLVRWLEERLRRELDGPDAPLTTSRPTAVVDED